MTNTYISSEMDAWAKYERGKPCGHHPGNLIKKGRYGNWCGRKMNLGNGVLAPGLPKNGLKIIVTKMDFEKYLQDSFIEMNEIGGIPITKDNCEDLFENWIENISSESLCKFADSYGQYKYLEGKEEVLKYFETIIKK